jgi:hypothetical protein
VPRMRPDSAGKRMQFDQVLADDTAVHEMVIDDAREHGRIARGIPRAFGIYDGNRTALADAQAIGFRAEDAALVGKPELLEPSLEVLPCDEAAFLVAALRRRLIAAEKDVAACDRHTDRRRDPFLGVRHPQMIAASPRVGLLARKAIGSERSAGLSVPTGLLRGSRA